MGAVTSALQSAASSFGAEVRTGAAVDRIVVDNGRVTGVALDSGEELHAPGRDRHDPPEDHLPASSSTGTSCRTTS